MKVQVFIAVHCPPKVLKLTLGSWLDLYDGSYEVEVHLGLHSNYGDYHQGLEDIQALEGPVSLRFIDEIDWYSVGLTRYSEMHARNLLNMMRSVKDKDFSHAFLFDHDLVFQTDFVRWVLDNHQDADMVGSLLDDADCMRQFKSDDGPTYTFFPKVSVWNLGISRRCFDGVMNFPDAILPVQIGEEVYDTFSRGLEWARYDWGFDVRLLPTKVMEEMILHHWSASFNFGGRFDKDYSGKIQKIEDEYDSRYPEGIGHLLEKIG